MKNRLRQRFSGRLPETFFQSRGAEVAEKNTYRMNFFAKKQENAK
jgi:hypothetical protein